MNKISLLQSVAAAAMFAVRHFVETNRSKIIFTLLAFGVWPPALTGQATLTVTNIATGSQAIHSLFLKSDGCLWTMGFDPVRWR